MKNFHEEELTPEEERDAHEFDLHNAQQGNTLSNQKLTPELQKSFLKNLANFLIDQKNYTARNASKVITGFGRKLNYFSSAINEAVDDIIDLFLGPI